MLQLAIVNGQNNFFYNGQVVDKNGDGIPFAHIETQFEEIFRCDIDGFFKLSTSKNSSTILISAIGYNEKLVKLRRTSQLWKNAAHSLFEIWPFARKILKNW